MRVYFGRLARDTRESDMERLLKDYGKFVSGLSSCSDCPGSRRFTCEKDSALWFVIKLFFLLAGSFLRFRSLPTGWMQRTLSRTWMTVNFLVNGRCSSPNESTHWPELWFRWHAKAETAVMMTEAVIGSAGELRGDQMYEIVFFVVNYCHCRFLNSCICVDVAPNPEKSSLLMLMLASFPFPSPLLHSCHYVLMHPRSSRFGETKRTGHRVIIENLSTRCSWQDLKDEMRRGGDCTYSDAHRLRDGEGCVSIMPSSVASLFIQCG